MKKEVGKLKVIDDIYGGRKFVFRALVGSHNYNLAGPQSDKDYHHFILPSFEDLYFNKEYNNNKVSADVDLTVHDIRKLSSLLFKANINYLEVIYSIDIFTSPEFVEPVAELLSLAPEIGRMNLPYLYHACGGMHHNKMKLLEKGTQSTQELVEKFGYDTKQAMHAYRVLDFCIRFCENNFSDFKAAMTYTANEKNNLLMIKQGFYTLDVFKNVVATNIKNRFDTLKERFTNMPVNHDLHEHINSIIKEMVRSSL